MLYYPYINVISNKCIFVSFVSLLMQWNWTMIFYIIAGLTACTASYTSGNRMKCTQVVSAHGLPNPPPYNSVVFSIAKTWFYHVLVNILSKDMKIFYIKLNGRNLSRTYSHWGISNDDDGKFTGSTSVFIKAAVKDGITIEGSDGNLQQGSCLTVLKL